MDTDRKTASFYFIVDYVGLACQLDNDAVDVFTTEEQATAALKDPKYSNCNCGSMCICPWFGVKLVKFEDLSSNQQKLLQLKKLI